MDDGVIIPREEVEFLKLLVCDNFYMYANFRYPYEDLDLRFIQAREGTLFGYEVFHKEEGNDFCIRGYVRNFSTSGRIGTFRNEIIKDNPLPLEDVEAQVSIAILPESAFPVLRNARNPIADSDLFESILLETRDAPICLETGLPMKLESYYE